MENRVANPYQGRRSRGGLHPIGGADPFFDDDTPQRVVKLIIRLSECPDTLPYLKRYEMYWGPRESDGNLVHKCARCRPGPCACPGGLGPRRNEFMVACCEDPAIWPIFHSLKLEVTQ